MKNDKKVQLMNLILVVVLLGVTLPPFLIFREKADYYRGLFVDNWDFAYLEPARTYDMYAVFSLVFPIWMLFPLANMITAHIFKIKKYMWVSIAYLGFTISFIILFYFVISRSQTKLTGGLELILIGFYIVTQIFNLYLSITYKTATNKESKESEEVL